MTGLAAVLSAVGWPLALIFGLSLIGRCASLWIRLRAEAEKALLERDEREKGAVAQLRKQMEACEESVRKMKVEQQTFMANTRR